MDQEPGAVKNRRSALLDRSCTEAAVEDLYGEQLCVLDEVVDYGSDLVVRCFNSSDRHVEDVVLVTILLKQAVAMLDACVVLCRAGCNLPAQIPTRSLLEISFYWDWIQKERTRERALAYYVRNLRDYRLECLRLIPGTAERDRVSGSPILREPSPGELTSAKQDLARVERLLGQDEYRPLNEIFFDHSKRLGYEMPWYKAAGGRSVSGIAAELGRSGEYALLYSTTSGVVHGSSYSGVIDVDGSELRIFGIRSADDIGNSLVLSGFITLSIFRGAVESYRPEELERFARRYVVEWRERLQNTPR